MGLHVGEADERNGNYFGREVNLAARVMSAGHGGQILISAALAVLARDFELIDLGEHQLAGIDTPQRLFQVSATGLRSEFPAPRAARGRTNLPFSTDVFVGRTDELKKIGRLLTEHRVVSLVGPGGAGKTRLSLEAARAQHDDQRDGAWFVDLTPVTDETSIVHTIATSQGVSEAAGRPLDERLADELASRRLLLVLDNCEHVVDISAALVVGLLHGAPGLRVLATTREPLGVAGEAVVAIGGLSPPNSNRPGRFLESEAVQLFLSRGRAACSTFVGEGDDLVHVAEICRLVDCLPLAIELAAIRLRAVSVSELASRLSDQLAFLGTAPRAGESRHRTMEAVVDWSYGLLDPDERLLLRRLAVFSGGFTIAGAERVCGFGDLEPGEVFDRLVGLVDKSLVHRLDASGGSRYRLLETIRDFAAARLAENDKLEVTRDRHLSWAMDLIGDLERAIRTEAQDRTLALVVAEHDNFRAARSRALERNDAVSALRISASAPIDPNSERGPLLAELLERAIDAPLSVQARARYTCVTAAFEGGDYEGGAKHGRLAMAMFHELDDPLQEAYAILMGAFCRWGLHEPDIGPEIAKAAAIFDRLDDTMGRAYTSWTMGQWLVEHSPDNSETEALALRGVCLPPSMVPSVSPTLGKGWRMCVSAQVTDSKPCPSSRRRCPSSTGWGTSDAWRIPSTRQRSASLQVATSRRRHGWSAPPNP
jgi:predicted ATPase